MSNATPANAATPPSRPALGGLLLGTVISDKRNKTRTVAVEWVYRHPKYGKQLRRQTNFQVHDEANASKEGDKVEITNCRPISRTKTWRLIRVVESAPVKIEHVTEAQA